KPSSFESARLKFSRPVESLNASRIAPSANRSASRPVLAFGWPMGLGGDQHCPRLVEMVEWIFPAGEESRQNAIADLPSKGTRAGWRASALPPKSRDFVHRSSPARFSLIHRISGNLAKHS